MTQTATMAVLAGRHAEEESLALKEALSSANSRLAKLDCLEADVASRAKEIQVCKYIRHVGQPSVHFCTSRVQFVLEGGPTCGKRVCTHQRARQYLKQLVPGWFFYLVPPPPALATKAFFFSHVQGRSGVCTSAADVCVLSAATTTYSRLVRREGTDRLVLDLKMEISPSGNALHTPACTCIRILKILKY